MNPSKAAFFAVTGLLFLVLQLSLIKTFPMTDEAQFLTMARMILFGKVPYRDFSDMHTPGVTYMTASVFRLFGESYSVARGMMVAISLATAFLVYMIGRRVFSERAGVAAYLMFGIYAPVLHNFLLTTFPFIALLTAMAVLLFLDYFETEGRPKLFLAGVLLGIGWLFRQTSILSFLGFFAGLLAFRTFFKKRKGMTTVSDSALLIAGALLPIAVYLLCLHAQGALPDFVDEIFRQDYARYAKNTLARYPLLDLKVQLVSVFSFIFVLPFAARAMGKRTNTPEYTLVLFLAIFSLPYVFPNFAYPAFIPVLVPGALCAGRFFSENRRLAVPAAVAILLVSAYFYSHRAFKDEFSGNNEFNNYNFYEIPDYIRTHTSPGDTIYGFSGVVNYFLAGRSPASKYWFLKYVEPDMEKRQLEVIRDLEQNRPKYVAYIPNQFMDTEKVCDFAPLVDEYILKNYGIERDFKDAPMGTVWLMVRRI